MASSPHPLPWWPYLPPQRQRQLRWRLRRQRLFTWMRRRKVSISLAVASYGLFILFVLVAVHPMLAGFALLPLLLLPPVGFLIYWLMWQEFHH